MLYRYDPFNATFQHSAEKLRRICAVEKGRVAVAVNQRSEIEHLVHEQREAISHLQKSNRSMGHVKNIRDHIDSTEEDTPVKRNLSGSNSTSAMKMHSDMAVELDWLKRRREAIEQVEGDRAAIQQTAHNPGSFIYGHNLVPDTISQVSSGNSAHIGNYTFSPTDQSHSATGDTLNFDRRQREIIVLREEERRRREQEELERMKHEQELQRVKDLLRKQREENEIDELRRSSEEFAEKLKIKREQELADKEEELRKREADLVRQREADRLMGDQRALEALRIARENRSKINKAFDIEARRQSFDAEKLEAEAEAVAAVERAVMKQQQEAFAISTTRQKEVDDEFERARVAEEQERGTEAKKLEEQLQAQRQQNEAESRLREEREKVEAQEAAKIAARKIQESASALLEKFRQQDFDEAYMKSNQDEVDETVQKAKDAETENCRKLEEEKEAEVERIRILNKRAEESLRAQRKLEADEKAQENERQKLAMEKSIAAKEEANRLRQLAEEEEEREAAANAAAAEEERLQAVEQALAEEHRKLEASRAAEEANKKKEDDSNALQAARAKVLARRKQKQERDSVESLISEGNASIRNSQTELPIQDVPKPEENMSIIVSFKV